MLYPVELRAHKKRIIAYFYLYNSFINEYCENFKNRNYKNYCKKVAVYLNKEKGKTVAICNANTLVRSYNNSSIQNKINSFDIKAPDGFPVAKASKILYQNNQKRVDGFK